MLSFLLPIIYVAFISLGLPDSLLGAAWPVMGSDVHAPLEAAGAVSMIIAGGTIISSLMSNRLTKKLGAGLVTAISVAMTAVALAGFSFAPNFIALCLWAIPYGLGAGAVDSALNNYVALHYKARHMSWLHCFWGVGASAGPYIMGFFLTRPSSWHGGYRTISLIQIVLTAVLFVTLPLWKKSENEENSEQEKKAAAGENSLQEDSLKKNSSQEKSSTKLTSSEKKSVQENSSTARSSNSVLKIDGIWLILVAFFGYCAMESTTGLWASSYLVNFRGIAPETAARFASFFYLGITGGRFVNGFIAEKFGDRIMTRTGIFIAIFGICMIALPVSSDIPSLAGLIVTGIGCAPIYPSIIHATPANFGRENSQAVVGIQMASAYVGTTFMPPVFGMIAAHVSISLYPFYLLFFSLIILIGTEILNRKKQKPL